MGEIFLAFTCVILVLVVIYIHKNEKEKAALRRNQLHHHHRGERGERHYRFHPHRNIADSAKTTFWEVNSQPKESTGWLWGKEKPQSPRKKLLFEGADIYRNNDILGRNNEGISPLFEKKATGANPYSLFSGGVKKEEEKCKFDNNYVSNLNSYNIFGQPKPNFQNNSRPVGSLTSHNQNNNLNQNYFGCSTFNTVVPQGNENNYQGKVVIVKAEEYIKKNINISPLNKTTEDVISLEDVNPSLCKYIDRSGYSPKFEEKKEAGVKMEEEKNATFFEELVPKKLNFNIDKTAEKKEENKEFHESFNSFAEKKPLGSNSAELINNELVPKKVIKENILSEEKDVKRRTSF